VDEDLIQELALPRAQLNELARFIALRETAKRLYEIGDYRTFTVRRGGLLG